MAQPKNFGFGEEEQMLRDTAHKFFQDNLPIDKLHALVAADPNPLRSIESLWDKDLWQQLVNLGWTQLAVPEAAGGIGMNASAVAGLVEEVGGVALPSPLISTLCSTYVLAACDNEKANIALSMITEGKSASLAVTDSRGSWAFEDTDVVASCLDENTVLNGRAWYVQDAQKADFYVVSAKSDKGIGLYQVAKDVDGLAIIADAIVDLTRDQACLEFKNVVATQLVACNADSVLNQAKPALLVINAADICGAAEWQLQTTVEYAKVRQQFDHPIGFFQAVKHPLVDLMLMIDRARSLLYNAACAIDSDPQDAMRAALMASAAAKDVADYGSSRSVQLHGGIGFTWECFVHIYFKRQKHNQFLWGDAAYQRTQLADILMGPISD